MKILQTSRRLADDARRGAALLLAFLLLIVIIAIVYQIQAVTMADARITRNGTNAAPDGPRDPFGHVAGLRRSGGRRPPAQAAEAGGGEGRGAAAPGATGDAGIPGDPGGGGDGEAGEPPRNPESVDSQMDTWYTPQSTNFGDLQIRIFIRDENSKYNVLNMLNEDEELRDEAFEIVVRVIDNFRGDTDYDVGRAEAEEMASRHARPHHGPDG